MSEQDKKPTDSTENVEQPKKLVQSVVANQQTQPKINLEEVEDNSPKADDFINFEDLDEEQATTVKEEKKEKPTKKVFRNPQNTVVEEEYARETDKHDPNKETISMPTMLMEELVDFIDDQPAIDFGSSESGKNWVNTLNDSVSYIKHKNIGLKAMEAKDAEFAQNIPHESGKLATAIQRGRINGGAVVTGEKAVLGLRSATNTGIIVRQPLWHSGFWLSIKSPFEIDLLETQRSITATKVDLGRHTWGFANSAISGIITEQYYDLIINNFYNTSLKDKEELKNLILLNDLPILIWQLACAVYPNGFQFSRACTANPQTCLHVSKEFINPSKLIWVNRNALTQEQKNHMSSKQSGSMDKESILKYQKQHLKGQKRELKYTINNTEIKIVLKIPTLAEYFDATHEWVDKLHDKVVEALGLDSTTKDRNNYINRLSEATALRQYSHYVESIDYGDIIEDKETINMALESLSTETELVEKFLNDVETYINDTTIALIGIPDYDCPACKGAQNNFREDSNPLIRNVIPIDPLITFFTLHFSKQLK